MYIHQSFFYLFVAAMNNKSKPRVQQWPVDSHGSVTSLSAGGELKVTLQLHEPMLQVVPYKFPVIPHMPLWGVLTHSTSNQARCWKTPPLHWCNSVDLAQSYNANQMRIHLSIYRSFTAPWRIQQSAPNSQDDHLWLGAAALFQLDIVLVDCPSSLFINLMGTFWGILSHFD